MLNANFYAIEELGKQRSLSNTEIDEYIKWKREVQKVEDKIKVDDDKNKKEIEAIQKFQKGELKIILLTPALTPLPPKASGPEGTGKNNIPTDPHAPLKSPENIALEKQYIQPIDDLLTESVIYANRAADYNLINPDNPEYKQQKIDECTSNHKNSLEKAKLQTRANLSSVLKEYHATADGPRKILLAQKYQKLSALAAITSDNKLLDAYYSAKDKDKYIEQFIKDHPELKEIPTLPSNDIQTCPPSNNKQINEHYISGLTGLLNTAIKRTTNPYTIDEDPNKKSFNKNDPIDLRAFNEKIDQTQVDIQSSINAANELINIKNSDKLTITKKLFLKNNNDLLNNLLKPTMKQLH